MTAAGRPDPRLAWCSENPETLQKLGDVYAAITKDGLVAHGKALADVRAELRKKAIAKHDVLIVRAADF